MSSELFIEDFIQPVLYLFAFALIIATWGTAVWNWYQAKRKEVRQAQSVVEAYPFAEFYCDLCQYAHANYTEAEARGLYAAWHERVLLREEVKQ